MVGASSKTCCFNSCDARLTKLRKAKAAWYRLRVSLHGGDNVRVHVHILNQNGGTVRLSQCDGGHPSTRVFLQSCRVWIVRHELHHGVWHGNNYSIITTARRDPTEQHGFDIIIGGKIAQQTHECRGQGQGWIGRCCFGLVWCYSR